MYQIDLFSILFLCKYHRWFSNKKKTEKKCNSLQRLNTKIDLAYLNIKEQFFVVYQIFRY